MIVAVAVVVVAGGFVGLLHWHGVVADEQAADRRRLEVWEARLRRTLTVPPGGCRSLAECVRNVHVVDSQRAQIADLEEAYETLRCRAVRGEVS